MAEEDLIFGKNRHMYGGIEPSNMDQFSLSTYNGHVRITARLPVNSLVNGQLVCSVAGAIIRRSETDYPRNEFDGDFVADITGGSSTYRRIDDTETNLNTTYYYAAFPYSTQGVYNRSPKNRALRLPTGSSGYYCGYDLNLIDSNPATRVTYPMDVQNADFNPVEMRDEYFSTGGWGNAAGYYAGSKFFPKPCIINTTDNSIKYVKPDDYSLYTDGTSVTTSSNTLYMMEWPKIYTHREVVDNVYKFRCSDVKLGDDWDCWCNYDINDKEIDHFYTAIYVDAGNASSTVPPTSLPGDYATGYASSLVYVLQYPKKIGADWNTEVLSDRLLIQDLLIMLAKSTDMVTAYAGTNSISSYSQGAFQDKGLFYGGVLSNGNAYTKVFGMESFFGYSNRLLAGFAIDLDRIYAKYTSGKHDGSTATDYNSTGDGYIQIGILSDYTSSYGSYTGYVSGMLIDSHGRIPILKDGSSSTYEMSQFSYYRANSGQPLYAYIPGGVTSNLFSINATRSSSESSTFGAIALSYKPRK